MLPSLNKKYGCLYLLKKGRLNGTCIGKNFLRPYVQCMKSISSTKNLKENCLLRVYKKGFGYAILTIVDINDYFLAAIAPDDLYSITRDGDTLDTYFWKEDIASYNFILTVIGRAKGEIPILIFSHTGEIKAVRERKCLSAAVHVPIKFYPLDRSKNNKRFYTEDIVFGEGTILEMSDREAVVECAGEIKSEYLIRFHIPTGKADVEITAKIISHTTVNNVHHYSVEYAGLGDKERNRLLDYIFTIYRE